jgi:hypothetical protein
MGRMHAPGKGICEFAISVFKSQIYTFNPPCFGQRPLLYLIAAPPQVGSKLHPKTSSNRSQNSPVRALLPLKSVSSCVTRTGSLKYDSSPATKYCAYSNLMVSQRTKVMVNFIQQELFFRAGSFDSRRSMASGEEGGRCTEAPRDESEGQGFQVSVDPDRVAHSPAGSLLQVEAADPTYIQVRLCDSLYSNSMM